MRISNRFFVVILLVTPGFTGVDLTQAQTNAPESKAKIQESRVLDVDKIVAHPEKFKGQIGVAGRVAKVDSTNSFFALGCEDACVVMPVKFSGPLPKEGSDVVVRGEVKKDSQGRYLFDAQKVTEKR